ncbi:gamma-glutamylcysteine synthetase [Furfurilactobacillus cerevisiae]|uniref:gamma-glutamylcysteine synthetase n=1 Tax=Furfurilactobacillus rossiae TaxID=231049 RepID=UPI003B98032E
MVNLIQKIIQNNLENELWQSLMGIEVETQRVDLSGKLSKLPYPDTLGSRVFHPYLQTDFGETQTEWITDPMSDNHQLIQQLQVLHDVFTKEMSDVDRVWLLSMPPALTHEDRLFVREHFDRPKYQHYRDYLDGKFGIAHGLTTGVHLNFSLTDKFIETFSKIRGTSKVKTTNFLYWRILQNFLKYRWLLTYFFGASPIAESGYFQQMPTELQNPVRSIRNSNFGFNNGGQSHISYTTFEQHIEELQNAIDNGELYAQMEFYGPVRIKDQTRISDYATKGIKYLEFRVFDTNPFVPLGVDETELNFVRSFLIFCLVQPINPVEINAQLNKAAMQNNIVALQSPSDTLPNLSDSKNLLAAISAMLIQFNAPASLLQSVTFYNSQIIHPETTTAAKIVNLLSQGSMRLNMLALADKRFVRSKNTSNELFPDLAVGPNTQALLLAGVKIGLHVDWSSINKKSIIFDNGHRWQKMTSISPQVNPNVTQLFSAFPSNEQHP